MAQCMAPGCSNQALNKLGLRLRKPGIRKAVWAPDVEAYLCKVHAEDVGIFTIDYQPGGQPKTVDISVESGGTHVTDRQMQVKKTAA
jgi:hypothetical protein